LLPIGSALADLALTAQTGGLWTAPAQCFEVSHFVTFWSAAGRKDPAESRPHISKAVVNSYKVQLGSAGLSASTINVRLCAIRKLVSEAADNGSICLRMPRRAPNLGRLFPRLS